MSYEEAVAYLDALGVDAMKTVTPTLDRVQALCDLLNNPEKSVPLIHISGTNGKSSVARIATSVLGSVGLTVGTYTSPHLEVVRERITRNGQAIPEEEFGSVFDHIRPYIEVAEGQIGEKLTYFEILTAMFYLWASEAPVDVAVVEVGLGGRWDATNVADAPVAAITNIGLDHTEFMGTDRREIAREKSGIVKDAAAVVVGERDPEILAVIRDVSEERRALMLVADRDFGVIENNIALGGRYLTIRTSTRDYEELFLPLHGWHQGTNAAVALQSVISFLPAHELAEEVVREGFGAVSVPGRMETVPVSGTGPVILDVAHNPDGVSALVTALTETFAFERVVFVFGVLKEKDHIGILRELARLQCLLVITEPPSGRALDAETLAADATDLGLENQIAGSVADAVRVALDLAGSDDLVCITGSHYVVGEARAHLDG